MTTATTPLRYHGGKHHLAKRIVALFPPRCKNPNKPDADGPGYLHYCEPYAGGLSLLLANDPEGISEVANDLSGDLVNFWECLRDGIAFGIMRRQLEAMPFSEPDWIAAGRPDEAEGYWARSPHAPVDRAIAFFVRCRQSMAGRMKNFPPLVRTRTRRGMQDHVSAWLSAVEGLPAVHERLKRVAILNRDAVDVICKEDGARTLFYLDPPYLHSTRATTGEYAHEMAEADHERLLITLRGVEGRFLLSGYRSELYDDCAAANRWKRHDFDLPNHAAGGGEKRRMTECVWCNF
jgi:DNA adenine methylase